MSAVSSAARSGRFWIIVSSTVFLRSITPSSLVYGLRAELDWTMPASIAAWTALSWLASMPKYV